jgi:MFS family permease
MLVLFFACLALFSGADGVASVAWFDILARTIPPKRRGRLMGTAQTLSGLFGIGAGALIGLCLNWLTFPGNYALIFGLAGIVFLAGVVATFLIREPPATDEIKAGRRLPGRDWLRFTLADGDFRQLLLSRFLVGTMALATSFYVKHAGDVLQLPPGVIGQFVIAQTLASLAASAGLGVICERWGPHTVIHIGGAAAALGPLFALMADLTGTGWLTRAYPIVYVALGIINSTWLMGYVNYALEIAPAEMRPAYTGVLNTGMSLLVLLPMAGGWLLEATSYAVLFGTTALLAGIGFLVSLRLKAPRTRGAENA